ncbi:MAG TPA: response regulator [Anaerolineae bacterium]|nr:response regulator [Anaerolineae bacterium]MCB0176856.1 response regulator [Anaerolineae bacterium]MCB0223492.1 response regulator [Anaerolineae bacterium]MCB9102876.1 response regulator [Anaerolineales bacterium]HRV92453.1 response regulator [Anaerolineae bacterium]
MRKRILIVDDVPDWRATLENILKTECEVVTVDSYDSAMDVVRNQEIDLVIVDLRLNPTDENNRDGMQLLEKLMEYRINAIVLTGYPEQTLQEEAENKYQAFDFIDKDSLASNFQRIREIVREAFGLLENVEKAKNQAIRAARALQSVAFTDELSSWPLRRFRKEK